jgi:hypothetical protein
MRREKREAMREFRRQAPRGNYAALFSTELGALLPG